MKIIDILGQHHHHHHHTKWRKILTAGNNLSFLKIVIFWLYETLRLLLPLVNIIFAFSNLIFPKLSAFLTIIAREN